MQKPCRLCGDNQISEAEMRSTIDEYLEILPATLWVEQSAYESRLQQCSACEHQRQGTCVLCGCFVRVRAAKWRMSCPDAPSPQWLQGLPLENP